MMTTKKTTGHAGIELNMRSTIKGSLLEHFYPRGWDIEKLDACCGLGLEKVVKPAAFWHRDFVSVPLLNVEEMDSAMGNAIADQIELTRKEGRKLAIILPVGPMGMYKTVVSRLKAGGTRCDHVTTFNMDEWADRDGNTMPSDQPASFEYAMNDAFFGPLGELTVPKEQRNFASKANLPTYAEKIAAIKSGGGKLVTVYGIGRVFHIAFWEPHLAADYPTENEWKKQTHKIGVPLHPLTVEQNAFHSFSSRFTLVPCFANSIGPGLFLQSDFCIGGADGAYPERGAMWQGMSVCVTLQHGPSIWVPSSWMPTMAGRLFFIKELGGPLLPDTH